MHPDSERPAPLLDQDAVAVSPVWRFLQPGESTDPDADESYVRSSNTPPSPGEYASYLIRATFAFDHELNLPGLVQVDIIGQTVEFTPCSVFASGKAVDPLAKDAAVRLTRILKQEVSPARRWTLDVVLKGERDHRTQPLSGSSLIEALGLLAKLGRLRRLR